MDGRTGNLDLFISANKHFNSTSTVHCRHLTEKLLPKWKTRGGITKRDPKLVLIAVTDNGPDWNPENIINVFNAGRLWKEQNLDCLIYVNFAPGDSRFNTIEHFWSYINRCCAGVTLPVTLPGEELPPCKQNQSPVEEDKKTDQMFFQANTLACKYIDGKKFDGFRIKAHPENFIGKVESQQHIELKDMLNDVNKTKLKLEPYKKLQEEYKFLVKHMVKKHHYLQFIKCLTKSCSFCVENPINAKKFMTT